jgi:hypothetical protein
LVVFERFTDRARRVVVLAQEEARLLNHNYIGTEHILLGLFHEREGVAARALVSLGISLEAVRSQVEGIIGHGGQGPSGHIPFTPRAKKVLELSLREALQLGHNYIGTEHILLGLIREGEGVAAQVLANLGAELPLVRQRVIQLLSGYPRSGDDVLVLDVDEPDEVRQGFFRSAAAPRAFPQCTFCGRDLWGVDHYVAAPAVSMCESCIAAAHNALEAADDDQQLLTLPPQVFGTPPADDPRAIEKIVRALNAVFGPPPSDAAVEFVEDGDQLVRALLAAREHIPDLNASQVVVERVRFSTGEVASVGFALVRANGGWLSFVGKVVRIGERWLVSRTTVADVMGIGRDDL